MGAGDRGKQSMSFVIDGKLEACPNCGQNQSYFVDAYPVGDRLMEGVMFEYSFDGTDLVVKPTKDAERYLDTGLDKQYWINAVYDWLKVFDGTDLVLCPGCNKWT